MLLLTIIFLIQQSHLQLRKLSKHVDGKIIRRAFLEAKAAYVENSGSVNMYELVTYEEYCQRKNMFRNKVRIIQGRQELTLEERLEDVTLLPSVSDAELHPWVNPNLVDFNKELSCYSYLYDLEKKVAKAYI